MSIIEGAAFIWFIVMTAYYLAIIIAHPSVLLSVTPTSMIRAYIYTLLMPVGYLYAIIGYHVVSQNSVMIITAKHEIEDKEEDDR